MGKLKDNLIRVRVKDALPRELEKYAKDGIERKASATIMGVDREDGEDRNREEEEKRPLLVPPLSAEAKAQLKVISKKAQKLKGKKLEQQLQSLIDELIVSGTIQESQESMARSVVEL